MLTPVTTGAWTLQAQATGSPHMTAGGVGCTGSEATLTSALSVTVTGTVPGMSSAGAVALNTSPQTVASGASAISTGTFTTSYSQPVAASEALLAGCSYSITVTYTLQ